MSRVSAPTVESVLTVVGASILQALCLPRGPDVPVAEPVLFDAAEGLVADNGSVALLLGCRPTDSVTSRTIRLAGEGGLAAVVIKSYGEPVEAAVTEAQRCGIALLLAADAVSWPHLYRLLVAAVAHDAGGGEPVSAVVTGDLFALANAVAVMVGGAIAIEDLNQHVLAYSTVPGQPIDETRQAGILGRRVPAEFRLVDLYDEVRRSDTVRRVELEGIRPRLAMAIRAGDEPIGSIWAVEGDNGFLPDAESALQNACRLASLHILRLRTTVDLERSARAVALRALLDGRGGARPDALPTADSYDATVVAFDIRAADTAVDEAVRSRVVDLVTVYCESVHRQAACLAIGPRIYALIPTGRNADRTIVGLVAERVIDRASQSLGLQLRAGIGGTVTDLSDVAQSRTDADWALRVLAGQPDGPRAAAISDVRSRAILLQFHDVIAGDQRLTLPVLDEMAAHDAEKGSSYTDTLRAYLDAFGDVPTAAARIFLHQNTFRHRMRRMTEILRINLDDPDERLVLWLLLRATG